MTDLDRMRKRSKASLDSLERFKFELISVKNAVDAKATLIAEINDKLQLPVVVLPEFDIEFCDQEFHDLQVHNGYIDQSECKSLLSSSSSALVASDIGDVKPEFLMRDLNDPIIHSNQDQSDSDFDAPPPKKKVMHTTGAENNHNEMRTGNSATSCGTASDACTKNACELSNFSLTDTDFVGELGPCATGIQIKITHLTANTDALAQTNNRKV